MQNKNKNILENQVINESSIIFNIDEVNGELNTVEPVDPEDNYSTVIRTRLQSHSLVYAAEVDCCIEAEHKSLNNYCEIKTSRGTSINDLNLAW